MKTKIVVIGIVQKQGKILMRKKPAGSPPYKETWYLFGADIEALSNPEETLREIVKSQAGISIEPMERIGWDTEIKNDSDGTLTFYIYLDYLCKYVSGKIKPGAGIEKVEWIESTKLKHYDLVPPSRKLFKKLGHL